MKKRRLMSIPGANERANALINCPYTSIAIQGTVTLIGNLQTR